MCQPRLKQAGLLNGKCDHIIHTVHVLPPVKFICFQTPKKTHWNQIREAPVLGIWPSVVLSTQVENVGCKKNSKTPTKVKKCVSVVGEYLLKETPLLRN